MSRKAREKLAIARLRLRAAGDGSGASDEFVFDCVASSGTLDSYHSRFAESSLDKFVSDIGGARTIPFLDSHMQDGIGRVLGRVDSAKLVDGDVVATVSMLRDTESTPDAMRVDEHIRRIERGYFNEVSVGYAGGTDKCDLCGLDVWRETDEGMCKHWPGETYDGEVATYTIHDASLRELSLVSRAANPDAQIQRLRADAGWQSVKALGDELKTEPSKSLVERDGERWRAELFKTLCEEGVRAIGPNFDEEEWKSRMEVLDSTALEEQIALYRRISETIYPQGRQTVDSTSQQAGHTKSDVLVLPGWLFN